MRLDKFIWAVRLYKTRSSAAKACDSEKVKLNGNYGKAGKSVAGGHQVSVKVNPIWRTYKVLELPKSRVSAALVSQYIVETTDESDLKQLEQTRVINRQNLHLGIKGRPTKKDRRDIDQFRSSG